MKDKLVKLNKRFVDYLYDTSVDVKDRAFILFSTTVLFALFLAVPCGLIMKEPPIATWSTLIGAIAFTCYVAYVIRARKIAEARVVLSIILVFIFLPAMFFTNGGANGGAPIWLLLGTIYLTLIIDGEFRKAMLILDAIVMIICWIAGYLNPGLIDEYSRGGNFFDTIAALFIVSALLYIMITFQSNLYRKEEKDKNLQRLFEQTTTALASAIDAKDEYTHGHSARVAEYSRKIAEYCGKSRSECEEIYYVALLHDVGKIGMPEAIINKKGKLNEEEFAVIKQHPVLGAQILHSITEYPNLIIGARYHHERYDGKGYPDGMKGEDIPEVARIIAVADAYDAMTSKRSYRDPIPQQTVREEIVKGSGTQFDPKFAKIMQHLIDLDSEYQMREKEGIKALAGKTELVSKKIGDVTSDGIYISPKIKTIRVKYETDVVGIGEGRPALIIFDSLDGRYHDTEREKEELSYFEYAQILFDGQYICEGARKIEVSETKSDKVDVVSRGLNKNEYDITAVRFRDHAMITIESTVKTVNIIIALPDSARYAYIGLTGENCHLYDVDIVETEEKIDKDYIPRIAEEISYISGPAGDIPNVQVDGYRSDATDGIPITDGMKIIFHTLSLPTARLVWHCSFIDIFCSDDKRPNGPGYKEYALIRLDGENWESNGMSENKLLVNKLDDFDGWDTWKDANKKGFDCTVRFKREGNVITTFTENMGISIKNTTKVIEEGDDVYVSLTGDQVAITNIRIIREPEDDMNSAAD